MPQLIHQHIFDNGLVLLAEPMEWLESAAFTLALPSGCARDPTNRLGLSNFTCEMVQRGCGPRDSRQFMEDLDRLGAERSASVSCAHASFGAAAIADRITDVLAIFADMVQSPHLPNEQLEDGRQVCIHEIRAVEDDLAQRLLQELRKHHYPDPWGRASHGMMSSVEAISATEIRKFFQQNYSPNGAILSVAGKINWDQLLDQVGQLLGDWAGDSDSEINETKNRTSFVHIPHESSQTHIGVAYRAVPYGHPDYYQLRGAVGILSDGMSSRLFTEVRENRGLCYSVHASCHSMRGRGSVLCYAGTSTDRAQETLDVLIAELQRLEKGVEEEELNRLKARIKSALIIQQESSASRSGSMAVDWYFLGRVQRLDELSRIVDGLSCESISQYLHEHPPRDFTIVTLGAKELEVPRAIS